MTHHRETRAVRMPVPEPPRGTPVAVPLYQSAIFGFADPESLAGAMNGPEGDFAYSGYANPTVRALEDALTGLEGGAATLATSSGMAATSAVLHSRLRAGDHVVAQRALYGGTFAALRDLTDSWGVEVTYVGGDDPAELRNALRPETRLLWLETIANPTGFVADLPALAAEATAAGVTTVVDNTFATPLLCRPLEHGADIVVHSATKYLGGHHDVVGGLAVFADPDEYRRTWVRAIGLGVVADPFAAWLLLRGLKTLPLRVTRQCASAALLAERLAGHPAVAAVHYPGLPGHGSHQRARRVLDGGYGGTVAFDLAVPGAAHDFLKRLELVLNAGSLGGTETVAMHPATTSHRHLDAESLRAAGVGREQVRVALGIEHPEDLWADVEQALRAG
ncbi:methionine-gamma-lyase [Prauserella shujinwangii]|uniref:homocysteine desulfhydrase n=1 Tax=Prauserella shujinwangii TaxID=1453103 RepID=A0A2T0LQ13_9PSEU|nr:aminotransferase class I/II-fold pyridoxal phosphate-dependent enzyme [Prauserella shujinwangii]PRX45433.1 methionine-gamma-lyase [Prauserella shujinwangii]